MFIPNSIMESSKDLTNGIYELIDANTIHDMMKDIFTQKVGIVNNYLIDPFTFKVQICMRNSHYDTDEYKYRIMLANEKVRINMNPLTLRDILKFQEYQEIQGYIPDLKRYRPHIRVQSFIDMRR